MAMAVSMIILVVTMAIVSSVRQKLVTALELKNRNLAYLKAYSATNRVLYHVITSPLRSTHLEVQQFDGTLTRWNLYGEAIQLSQDVSFVLRDLSGMISPLSQRDLFRRLVEHVCQDSTKTNALLDAFQDWQDPDDLKRLNGAERWDYSTAGYSYGPRNFYIQALDELRLLKGFDPEPFEKIRQDIVYWNLGLVNYLTMSRQTLEALLPDQSLVQQVLDLRNKGQLTGMIFRDLTGMSVSDKVTYFPSGHIEFALTAREEAAADKIEGIIIKEESQSAPIRIVEWKSL
jgi:type II secretory pathway component PulK